MGNEKKNKKNRTRRAQQRAVPDRMPGDDPRSHPMPRHFRTSLLPRVFLHMDRSKSLSRCHLPGLQCSGQQVPTRNLSKARQSFTLWRAQKGSIPLLLHSSPKTGHVPWHDRVGPQKPSGTQHSKRIFDQKKFKSSTKPDRKGFALFLLIVLLPLCLSGLIGLFYVGQLFTKINSLESDCQKIYLSAQTQISHQLDGLLRLNTQARRLLQRKTKAKTQLALGMATGNLKLIAKAKADLALIHSQQLALKSKQTIYLTQAQLIAQRAHSRFRGLIVQNSPLTNLGSLKAQPFSLSVLPKPPHEVAPVYETPYNFEDLQKTDVRWKMSPIALVPDPFQKTLGSRFSIKSFEMSCSTTLRKRGQKWHAHLNRVKA